MLGDDPRRKSWAMILVACSETVLGDTVLGDARKRLSMILVACKETVLGDGGLGESAGDDL